MRLSKATRRHRQRCRQLQKVKEEKRKNRKELNQKRVLYRKTETREFLQGFGIMARTIMNPDAKALSTAQKRKARRLRNNPELQLKKAA